MSRIRTRGQLLSRLKRYRKVGAQASTTEDPKLRAFLDDAYARTWEMLTGSDAGFGLVRWRYTTSVETALVELPAGFSKLRGLVLNPESDTIYPEWGSEEQIDRLVRDRNAAQNTQPIYYQLEGPGDDYDEQTDTFTAYGQRLSFAPRLQAQTVVKVSFLRQPFSLADVDGQYLDEAQDATISVDVITEALEEALVAYAWWWAAGRADDKDIQRATTALREVVADYLATRDTRNQLDADTPARYQRGGRNGRYTGYGSR
jgi:hypothetical protein